MAKAIFAGSFDPFTLGHLDIVHEASEMFDEVWIVIASNDSKRERVYDAEKMATAIEETCRRADLKNCYATVLPSYMSIIEYAERNEIKFLVRGVRDADDFAYESKMADINKEFNDRIRTVFIHAHNNISSSLVRLCEKFGRPYAHLIPEPVRRWFGY